ncbi:hypothetical protein Ddye_013870 [Dipteronia dyeriana]|uniref:Membrane-associated kinase regulator 2 n=1 Tax=Dipteronia dyeriana TaxID=168575 RepID=A0AAD9X763_9ROSI|nr:hypothetical protein Ddye_013870 [Dipteronia dyeriana]
MEALSFLKFWSPTTNISHKENMICNKNGNNCGGGGGGEGSEIPSLVVESDCCCDDDDDDDDDKEDGDDSFFELELTVSDFDKKKNTSTTNINNNNSSDVLSKRKILPIEPTISKPPQSPIALLKSAPKLRVSIFKKSKSSSMEAATTTEKTESQKNEKKLFTVKFKFEQTGSTTNNNNNNNLSMFNRVCSLRKTQPQQQQQQHSHGLRDDSESVQSNDSSSKRFSKDVIQKYLKLIKPLYVKVSKKSDNNNNRMTISRLSGEFSEASPAASPATAVPMQSPKQSNNNLTAGFRSVSRHLGKSKSSSSAAVMSPARRDDSLLLQHDGIQSAILHCKKSFNSSRDSSSLSRSTSTSSQETFSNLSSKDSSLLSRFSSDSLSEESISARKSNESGNGLLEFKRERALFVHEN